MKQHSSCQVIGFAIVLVVEYLTQGRQPHWMVELLHSSELASDSEQMSASKQDIDQYLKLEAHAAAVRLSFQNAQVDSMFVVEMDGLQSPAALLSSIEMHIGL